METSIIPGYFSEIPEKKDRESLFINLPIFLLKLLRDERFEVELSA